MRTIGGDHRSRIWWLIMLNLLIILLCVLLICPRLCPHMFFLKDQLADLWAFQAKVGLCPMNIQRCYPGFLILPGETLLVNAHKLESFHKEINSISKIHSRLYMFLNRRIVTERCVVDREAVMML